MSHPYHKIYSPFKRFTEGPKKNQLNEEEWFIPEFGMLQGAQWSWTEKVDGTNIRLMWDGNRMTVGGKTDKAQLPAPLLDHLQNLIPEEILEQQFGEKPATLYGEGYGAGIQTGGWMSPTPAFALFDVRVGSLWLAPEDVLEVANALNLNTVPALFWDMTLREGIAAVKRGVPSAYDTGRLAEGLVGRVANGLLTRRFDRLIVKVKTADF